MFGTHANSYDLKSDKSITYDGSFTLSWIPQSGYSAYHIYENGQFIVTTGGGQIALNRSYGYKSYQLKGCISFGCSYPNNNSNPASNAVGVSIGNEITYAIRRHSTAPSLSNNDADTILSEATNVLNVDHGSGDVPCYIRLLRSGNVTQFTTGDGNIDNSQDWANLSNGINLVNEINYCSKVGTNIVGCGSKPGDKIAVVEYYYTSYEGRLWAHEVGHNVGLSHVSTSDSLMYDSLSLSNEKVTSSECYSYGVK